MRKRALTIVSMFFLSCTIAFTLGQGEDETPAYLEFPDALGLQAGALSATGVSYLAGGKSLDFQITAGIIYFPYDPDDTETDWNENTLEYSVGFEMQRLVFGDAFARWLSGRLYLFNAFVHKGFIPVEIIRPEYYSQVADEWIPAERKLGDFTMVVGTGVGVGIEFVLFRHFSIPIELGYGIGWLPLEADLADQFTVDMIPQVGFRYRY